MVKKSKNVFFFFNFPILLNSEVNFYRTFILAKTSTSPQNYQELKIPNGPSSAIR